jgi:hypothetical protein
MSPGGGTPQSRLKIDYPAAGWQTDNDALDKLGALLKSCCQERGRAVLTGMPSALARSRIAAPAWCLQYVSRSRSNCSPRAISRRETPACLPSCQTRVLVTLNCAAT